jgi:hypothetical protein
LFWSAFTPEDTTFITSFIDDYRRIAADTYDKSCPPSDPLHKCAADGTLKLVVPKEKTKPMPVTGYDAIEIIDF